MKGKTSRILVAAMVLFLFSGPAVADEMKEKGMTTDQPSMENSDEKMMKKETPMRQSDPMKKKEKSVDMETTMENTQNMEMK